MLKLKLHKKQTKSIKFIRKIFCFTDKGISKTENNKKQRNLLSLKPCFFLSLKIWPQSHTFLAIATYETNRKP